MLQKDDMITDITPDVKWIGVLDYDIRTFDIVMHTEYGTTYNSYFINADKKALVEVAKEKFSDIYLSKLRSVTDPEEIEYIILDHTEPDHSGSLKLLLDIAPEATVVGSGNAIRYLQDIVNVPFKSMVVKEGDKLDLGNRTLSFISAPNLHWPDSIYTFLEEEKILFTCDSFGAHYCSSDIFSKLTDTYVETFKYYFDVILKPFSRFMLKAIDKIKPFDIKYICPGHGPVHGENLREVIGLTEEYCNGYLDISGEREKKNILITYVSAYGYTGEAAQIIAKGILSAGGKVNVEVMDIENMKPEDLESHVIQADGILIGSPTINQNTLLPVYRLFSVINPIRDKGKLGGAFGSYGWSGESASIIIENLRLLKLRIFEGKASFKFSPGGDKKRVLEEYGKTYIEELLED